jgi:outer membrane lipoprotein SlyB
VPIANAPGARPEAVPVAQTVTTRAPHRVADRTAPVRTRYVRHTRSGAHSAEIIGGSAVGGAVIGGLVGGKKGAIIGGLVGAGAGTVYDRKTRHKVRRVEQ